MSLNFLQHKFNDQTGEFELHQDYLLFLHYSDGFTERLLNISLYVNLVHEYKLCISTFKNEKLHFEGAIPKEIMHAYEKFSSQNSTIKGDYFNNGIFISNASSYMYLFNKHNETSVISFDEHNIGSFSNYNTEEQLFLDFHNAISKWIFGIYYSTSDI